MGGLLRLAKSARLGPGRRRLRFIYAGATVMNGQSKDIAPGPANALGRVESPSFRHPVEVRDMVLEDGFGFSRLASTRCGRAAGRAQRTQAACSGAGRATSMKSLRRPCPCDGVPRASGPRPSINAWTPKPEPKRSCHHDVELTVLLDDRVKAIEPVGRPSSPLRSSRRGMSRLPSRTRSSPRPT